VGYETYSIDTYLAIAGIVGSQWKKASTGQPPFDHNRYSRLVGMNDPAGPAIASAVSKMLFDRLIGRNTAM
jgi:hypothetical protein